MGGSAAMDWFGALGASVDAALAREEDEAAADLAFSLRQDTSLRDALLRSGTGWSAVGEGGASRRVDEVGIDYALAGGAVLRLGGLVLRTDPAPAPRPTDRTFLEVLGAACRAGATVEVATAGPTLTGVLTRVTRDHLALGRETSEVLVSLDAVLSVGLDGAPYSASRGFSG